MFVRDNDLKLAPRRLPHDDNLGAAVYDNALGLVHSPLRSGGGGGCHGTQEYAALCSMPYALGTEPKFNVLGSPSAGPNKLHLTTPSSYMPEGGNGIQGR